MLFRSKGKIDVILQGEDCRVGIESTVLDMSEGHPMILHPGIITKEQLENVLLRPVEIDPALTHDPKDRGDFRPKAPGMKYKHYAPKANILSWINIVGATAHNDVVTVYVTCADEALSADAVFKYVVMVLGAVGVPLKLILHRYTKKEHILKLNVVADATLQRKQRLFVHRLHPIR